MMQGTIPYPQWAESGPIRQLATALQQFSQGIGEQSDALINVKESATSSWLGEAAKAFGAKEDERAKTMKKAAGIFAKAANPLNQFATLIDTTKAAYQVAVAAENVARAGLPYTAAALKAAILAEKQIVFMQFYGGGSTIAGQLGMLELEAAGLLFAGVDRSSFDSVKSTVTTAWKAISEEMQRGDVSNEEANRQFNEVFTSMDAYGNTVRTNPVASAINAQPCAGGALEALYAGLSPITLLSQPEVVPQPQEPQVLAALEANGFDTGGQLGHGTRADNIAQLATLQRNLGEGTVDQSVPVHAQWSSRPDGSRILTLTVPGMLSADESVLPNGTGTRIAPYAASSQMTGTGQFEASVLGWVRQQGLGPGDTVNLYGYSQGGIVTRNISQSLSTDGVQVNLVSYASPDGPVGSGVNSATMFQNTRDFVPTTRIGGAGAESLTLAPGQQIVQFDAGAVAAGSGRDQHSIQHYGDYLDRQGSDPAIRAHNERMSAIYAGSQVVDNQIIVFGAPGPAGERVEVRQPVGATGR